MRKGAQHVWSVLVGTSYPLALAEKTTRVLKGLACVLDILRVRALGDWVARRHPMGYVLPSLIVSPRHDRQGA